MDPEIETLYIRQLEDLHKENEFLRAQIKNYEALVMMIKKLLQIEDHDSTKSP